MKIAIMNYNDKKVDIEIPDTGLISIYITIVSGDEIAIVNYQDGDMKVYDSAVLLNETIVMYIDISPVSGISISTFLSL